MQEFVDDQQRLEKQYAPFYPDCPKEIIEPTAKLGHAYAILGQISRAQPYLEEAESYARILLPEFLERTVEFLYIIYLRQGRQDKANALKQKYHEVLR